MTTSKRTFALLVAITMFATAAAPSGATAAFTYLDKGSLIKEKMVLPLSGSFNFSGGTNCNSVSSTVWLEPSGLSTVQAFSASKCEVTGTLKSLGCTTATGVLGTKTPWDFFNEIGTFVQVKKVNIEYSYTGGAFCPKIVVLSGEFTATPDNRKEISSYAVSGTLKSSVAGISSTLSGTLTPTNASDVKTYGLS